MNALTAFIFLLVINFCLLEKKESDHNSSSFVNYILEWNRKMDEIKFTDLLNKTWEGPFYYDLSLDSMITLPCVINASTTEHIHSVKYDISHGLDKSWALLWIHNTWTNVIDPWLGDGRRSYDSLENTDWNTTNIELTISQAYLSISDIDATDVGVYACVAVTYPIQNGYSPVDLKQTRLLSIHMIRIHSSLIVAPECYDENNNDNNNLENEYYCKTGFERWTFNVYYPIDGWMNSTLFHAPCNADIFLTALSINNIDPTVWSIGWKFVPYGQLDDTKVVEINENTDIQWFKPIYRSVDDSTSMYSSYGEFIGNITHLANIHNLFAGQIRALTYWKAHWLALNSSIKQRSGVWQCWIQRSLHRNHSTTTDNLYIRWLTNEVHVKIIYRKYIYLSEVISESWRKIVLIMAPLNMFLLFMLFTVGWYSTCFYKDKSKSVKRWNNATQFIQNQNPDESEKIFIPSKYVDEYLRKSGIESYKEYIIRRNMEMNVE
ncbi:unnamed protein product [Schistosoma turkestanicum]|nr:unnamed protein product [Schistosoma turkestanicum]